MDGLRARFGRRLRLGMIGGGPDSWIGRMHQGGALLDGWWDVAAGVFSSDPARSRASGAAIGVDPARSYGDAAEMLAREGARPDGIDAVAIMTPNDTHYPYAVAALDAGLDVICDKPVTHDFAQARDLVARVGATGTAVRDHPRLRRLSHDALRRPPRARAASWARCASCRSSTSNPGWRCAWRTAPRTTG